jgi:hypothetical protein
MTGDQTFRLLEDLAGGLFIIVIVYLLYLMTRD